MVNKSILQRFFGAKPPVAVAVFRDLLQGLAGRLSGNLSQALLHVVNQVGLGLDITSRSTKTTVGLVQQDSRIGGDVALTFSAGGEK